MLPCPGTRPGQGSTTADGAHATPWEGRKVAVPPPLAGATKEAGIVRARTSVLRRQNTVAQFVATRPILGLCEGTERRGGHGSPNDGGNSPGSTGGWRGNRKNKWWRRDTHTRTQLQGIKRRWRRHQDRERERGRRRHWGPVDPVGRNGAGRRIKAHSFQQPEIHR